MRSFYKQYFKCRKDRSFLLVMKIRCTFLLVIRIRKNTKPSISVLFHEAASLLDHKTIDIFLAIKDGMGPIKSYIVLVMLLPVSIQPASRQPQLDQGIVARFIHRWFIERDITKLFFLGQRARTATPVIFSIWQVHVFVIHR